MDDVDRIVAGLSKSQQKALSLFSDGFVAGPTLSDLAIKALPALRTHGLVERQFYDLAPARASYTQRAIKVHLAACWHFRLTDLGLRVRARLAEVQSHD